MNPAAASRPAWLPMACGWLALLLAPSPLCAQGAPAPAVRISGYVQTQYERTREAGEEAEDRVFFRRLVLAFDARPAEDWEGAVQIDVGPAASGDRVIVKDAYLRYTGWRERGLALTVGNQKVPFSRSLLTSSSRRALVERSFPGDKNFGSPGRSIQAKVDGWSRERRVQWSGALGSTLRSPDVDRLRFDGLPEAEDDWNQGIYAGGRVEWHPLGEVPLRQADFRRGPFRPTAAVAAFAWRNDGDRNTGDPTGTSGVDLDRANALEVSGALRGRGMWVDVELERITGDAAQAAITTGLFRHGSVALNKAGAEAGYLVVGSAVEIVGAVDVVDVDAFAAAMRRVAIGANWYLREHALKLQVLHRETFNLDGTRDARGRATYVMTQIAF